MILAPVSDIYGAGTPTAFTYATTTIPAAATIPGIPGTTYYIPQPTRKRGFQVTDSVSTGVVLLLWQLSIPCDV